MTDSGGVNIADCIWGDVELQAELAAGVTILDWLSSTLSFLMNLCATILIALKARNHYNLMKNTGSHQMTRTQNILLLLIESGAVYCTIQGVFEVMALLEVYAVTSNIYSQVVNILNDFINIVSACYPVTIIILVYKDASPIVEIFNHTQASLDVSDVVHSNAQTVQE
ncbi:hypothetical protein C8R42DRAFT_640374 [Lentinula raphanica]|nr:hypothetical protein C8R42DRAFT_640374 [Lentinula raphanica]